MFSHRSVPEYTTILAQVFSPCGQFYASGTTDGQVAVWKVAQLVARGEVDRGKELVRWKVGSGVFSLASTERHLIVGGREEVSGWNWDNIAGGQGVGESDWEMCMRGKGEVNSMVVMKEGGTEGRLVLGMGDNNVYMMDLETREVVRVFSGHTGYVHCVSCGMGEGEKTIVSGGEDGAVKLWDSRQTECVHNLKPGEVGEVARPKLGKHVTAVALSQDWLACGGGPRLALWHLKSLAVAATLPPANHEVKVVSFHDEVVMVGGRGRTLYQAKISGEVTAEVSVSSSVVYSIAHTLQPSILCVAGSSSNIDICAPSYNYKDVTIQFPVE